MAEIMAYTETIRFDSSLAHLFPTAAAWEEQPSSGPPGLLERLQQQMPSTADQGAASSYDVAGFGEEEEVAAQGRGIVHRILEALRWPSRSSLQLQVATSPAKMHLCEASCAAEVAEGLGLGLAFSTIDQAGCGNNQCVAMGGQGGPLTATSQFT